jgi:hypothetical protein
MAMAIDVTASTALAKKIRLVSDEKILIAVPVGS